jgi:hypothetical protein
MDWLARLAIVFALAANLAPVDALGGEPGSSGRGIVLAGPVAEEKGQWRTKVQTVFEPTTRTLTRRSYSVWDAAPSRDLDFTWQPADPARDNAGRINGSGHLVWRSRDKPSYDPSSIVAEYSGTLIDGRLEGNGVYVDRAGLKYEGEWRDGLMNGRGKLQLPAGDEYVGQFAKGKANGDGRLIDITGEVYEGSFAGGRKHGQGTTTLPTGISYPSVWTEGREDERSRKVRIAQAGGTNLPDTRDEVRIGIAVDRRLPAGVAGSDSALWYNAATSPAGFQIRPANGRLLQMWREKGGLQLTFDEELLEFQSGILSPSRQQSVPLNLRVELQNKSSSPIQMTGLYLDVQNSSTEAKPAIQVKVRSVDTCNADTVARYSSAFTLENYGWSTAEGVTWNFSLASPQGGDSALNISKKPGDLDKTLRVDLESDLKSMGVDTKYLSGLQEGFSCAAKTPGACLNQFRATGKMGKLTNFVQLDGTIFVLKFASTLEYSWRDAKSNLQNWTHPFTAMLPLSFIKPPFCGAEGGGPQIITSKAQQLRLDEAGYRIPIAYQATVPPTRTIPLVFPVEAPKSSSHDFTIVIQLADGREIRSRPVNLLYYRPRWTNQETPADSPDDLSGHGLNGNDLRQVQDPRGDKCEAACKADAKCLGYTQDNWSKVCSLKGQVTSKRQDPRLSSTLKDGVKPPALSTNAALVQRFAGQQIQVEKPYLVGLNSSLEDCEQSCKKEEDCTAFNFATATRICSLIDQEVDKPVPSPATSSGIKYQAAQ